ncbi:hypothetical protein [Stenotrophomonas sp. S41]|uniref:hypothetical protein n=1 Tax=Stenotrophomonas sp. S41 TaxID=2767464 RepID=UPI001F32A031|nr:hypothetical protein [Stenotrophomonas sp. S41]
MADTAAARIGVLPRQAKLLAAADRARERQAIEAPTEAKPVASRHGMDSCCVANPSALQPTLHVTAADFIVSSQIICRFARWRGARSHASTVA